MTTALMLCDLKRRFLFEVIPDVIKGGMLTGIECDLWGRYYAEKNQNQQV